MIGQLLTVLIAFLAAQTTVNSNQTPPASTPPDQLLLKEFRPQSIYKIPQTRVEKAKYPVIDMHSHSYARTPAEVDDWVRNMDAVGLAKSIVIVSSAGK